MFTRRNIAAALGGGLILHATSTKAKPADNLVGILDRIGKDQITTGQCAGLAIGVKRKGRILLCKGYGFADLSAHTFVNNRSIFRIASVTKIFTAVGIIKLQTSGKLNINDRLSNFFPDFPRAEEVIISQLLNHTAGIYDFVRGLPAGSSPHWTNGTEFIERLKKADKQYDFEPGTHYSYSNSGYVLLGAIIEKVSGQSLEEFFSQQFFSPLNMKDTAPPKPAPLLGLGGGNTGQVFGRKR